MTFATSIETAVQKAQMAAAPYMASRKEIEDEISKVIVEIKGMPDPVSYIRESFTHTGHQALAVRMFKGQST